MSENYYRNYGWCLADSDTTKETELMKKLGVTNIVARLLLNRGIDTPQKAKSFLNPDLEQLHDPMSLPDMKKGASRIVAAIKTNEKILIHGDYDVDGVSSAAVLVRTLERLGANVVYKIPHRKYDGYDIKPLTIDRAIEEGVKLIVTCDCGTTAVKAAEHAQKRGIDLIVTDHHEPAAALPNAYAVINPKRKDAHYPFTELAGVGVALKTAQAIASLMNYNPDSVLKAYLDLVTLGTVADQSPLLDENRAIVRFGLDAITSSNKEGLKSALKHTGYTGKTIDSDYIGFVLGPRMNAAGRLSDASISLQLLLTREHSKAQMIMSKLEEINSQRKKLQNDILQEAEALLNDKNLEELSVLVIVGSGWERGIVGNVAGTLSNRYGLPAIVLSKDDKTGICSGSGRSIAGFHLKEALDLCQEHLTRYGGHAAAVGVSLVADKLEDFENTLNAIAKQMLPEELIGPRIDVDLELSTNDINKDLYDEVCKMQPFGNGNPEPTFITSGLTVTHSQSMGGDGEHLKLFFEGEDSRPLECVAFNWGKYKGHLEPGSIVNLCYNLKMNTFNGNKSIQMNALDIRKDL